MPVFATPREASFCRRRPTGTRRWFTSQGECILVPFSSNSKASPRGFYHRVDQRLKLGDIGTASHPVAALMFSARNIHSEFADGCGVDLRVESDRDLASLEGGDVGILPNP